VTTRLRPRLAGTLALVLVFAVAPTAFADDGEIGDMGDSNSITDVYVSGDGRPAVAVDYLHDCPAAGISDCWIEVRWVSKCPEFWCGWETHPWKRLPPNGIAKGDCYGTGNEDNQWYVEYKTAYVAPATITAKWKGEFEWVLDIYGAFGYRMIAEALLNVTAGVGFSGGQTVETVTAKTDYGPIVQVASSGGRILHTC
jgi:hypothetical protein